MELKFKLDTRLTVSCVVAVALAYGLLTVSITLDSILLAGDLLKNNKSSNRTRYGYPSSWTSMTKMTQLIRGEFFLKGYSPVACQTVQTRGREQYLDNKLLLHATTIAPR